MTFLLLIFGFILIEMPIVAFLSVVNDVHQPLPILIMALICTVIDVFIITNRITFHKANGGNEERMRKIRKAVKITAIIIAVCLLPGTWFVSEEGYKANRKKGSSYDYNYLGSHSSYDSRVFGSSSDATTLLKWLQNVSYEHQMQLKHSDEFLDVKNQDGFYGIYAVFEVKSKDNKWC